MAFAKRSTRKRPAPARAVELDHRLDIRISAQDAALLADIREQWGIPTSEVVRRGISLFAEQLRAGGMIGAKGRRR